MARPSIGFFLMNFVLLFLAIGFIIVVFELNGYAFVFELGMLLILMFLIVLSMFFVYHDKNWGWTMLGLVLILILFDVLFIMIFSQKPQLAHVITILFSVIGLIMVAVNLGWTSNKSDESKSYEETSSANAKYDNAYETGSNEEVKTIAEEHSITKTFSPGKFIASKKANKFHSPKCDWAKRISKPNRIWFGSREDAESKGFEADRCIT